MRDAFGARVIAARLGADGIVTELRGVLGGPYPIGCVSIWVRRDEAEIASDLLLADEVESAFDRDGDAGDEWDGDEWDAGEDWDRPSPRPIIFGWTARRVAALLAVLIILATVAGRLIGA